MELLTEYEMELVTPEIKEKLFGLMEKHGGFNEAYYVGALRYVEKRMKELEAEISDAYFKAPSAKHGKVEWLRAPEADSVNPNMRRYNNGVFKEARAARAETGLRNGMGVWYMVGDLGSRFSPSIIPENERISLEETIDFAHILGVEALSFHTPMELGPANLEATIANLQKRGMRIGSAFANVFSDTAFKYGGITSPYAMVRELAYLRKLQGFFWCAQNKCAFQVDWLGQDGPFTYDRESPRREFLVQYYADMLMLTGQRIAIEFKPGDPAIRMTEADVESILSIAREAEELVYHRIKEKVMKEKGIKADMADILEESVRRFASYVGKIGVNIEDAHVYTKTVQNVTHAVERSINEPLLGEWLNDIAMLHSIGRGIKESDDVITHYKGRLWHRHPNDAYVANGDPDLLPGIVHMPDLILASYHEQKAEIDQDIVYEPDLFAVRGDPIKNYIAAVNAVNYAHAVAGNLIDMEEKEVHGGNILDAGQELLSSYLIRASRKSLKFREIPLEVADEYRAVIGKPVTFPNVQFQSAVRA